MDHDVIKKALTPAQLKAVVALAMLGADQYHYRANVAWTARGDGGPGYPVKTMRALQREGLAEPYSEDCVRAVEEHRCHCGCDTWTITCKGKEFVDGLEVRHADQRNLWG